MSETPRKRSAEWSTIPECDKRPRLELPGLDIASNIQSPPSRSGTNLTSTMGSGSDPGLIPTPLEAKESSIASPTAPSQCSIDDPSEQVLCKDATNFFLDQAHPTMTSNFPAGAPTLMETMPNQTSTEPLRSREISPPASRLHEPSIFPREPIAPMENSDGPESSINAVTDSSRGPELQISTVTVKDTGSPIPATDLRHEQHPLRNSCASPKFLKDHVNESEPTKETVGREESLVRASHEATVSRTVSSTIVTHTQIVNNDNVPQTMQASINTDIDVNDPLDALDHALASTVPTAQTQAEVISDSNNLPSDDSDFYDTKVPTKPPRGTYSIAKDSSAMHVPNSMAAAVQISPQSNSLAEEKAGSLQLNNTQDRYETSSDDSDSSSVSSDSSDSSDSSERSQAFIKAGEAIKGNNSAEWQPGSENNSSNSSSSDSEDDDDDDEEDLLNPEEALRIMMAEDNDEANMKGVVECDEPEEKFEIPDVVITPAMTIKPLGTIESRVGRQLLVLSSKSGEQEVLDQGSILCLEDRTLLGQVVDPVGPVPRPMYRVGFPTVADLDKLNIDKGTSVYYVAEFAKYVFTNTLLQTKAIDAADDDEEEIYFSDDEKEQEWKRQQKGKRKRVGLPDQVPEAENRHATARSPERGRKNRSRRGGRGNIHRNKDEDKHHLDQPEQDTPVALNYGDDNDDGLYQPLRRPDNLDQKSDPQNTRLVGSQPKHKDPRRGQRDGRRDKGGRGHGRSRGGRGGYHDHGYRGDRNGSMQQRDGYGQLGATSIQTPRNASGTHQLDSNYQQNQSASVYGHQIGATAPPPPPPASIANAMPRFSIPPPPFLQFSQLPHGQFVGYNAVQPQATPPIPPPPTNAQNSPEFMSFMFNLMNQAATNGPRSSTHRGNQS
jgi:hypothetical protein